LIKNTLAYQLLITFLKKYMYINYVYTILFLLLLKIILGMSLVPQWLRLHAPKAGGAGSTRVQGTRSHTPQLRVCILQLKGPTSCNADGSAHVSQLGASAAKLIY
ncbi:UNVERIFIED_CONTAM: hypothetical protein DQE83_26990, partial [Escherichia coli]